MTRGGDRSLMPAMAFSYGRGGDDLLEPAILLLLLPILAGLLQPTEVMGESREGWMPRGGGAFHDCWSLDYTSFWTLTEGHIANKHVRPCTKYLSLHSFSIDSGSAVVCSRVWCVHASTRTLCPPIWIDIS